MRLPSYARKMILLLTLLLALFSTMLQAKDKDTTSFLVLTDVHLGQVAWYPINLMPSLALLSGDLDVSTLNHFVADVALQIKHNVIPKPQFILYLGDMTGHVRIGSQFVWRNQVAFFKTMATYFPDTPIFYTFGNNDAYDRNYGDFSSLDATGHLTTPLDAALASGMWQHDFLSNGKHCDSNQYPCVLSENQHAGYYSAKLAFGLRLINLNTVLFSTQHHAKDSKMSEAQLSWFAHQLQNALRHHERILLVMHIPLGKNIENDALFLKPIYQKRLIKLIQHHQANILGILAGHTHFDEIKLLKTGKSLTGLYINPALSTSHGNLPAIRSYTYGKQHDQWQLIDYTTFYFGKNQRHWSLKKLYSFRETYCRVEQEMMSDCLKNVTAEGVYQYYMTGQVATTKRINHPENIYIYTK